MMRLKIFRAVAVTLILAANVFAWQREAHLITLPIIEGGGIYASVMALKETETPVTKAAAITTLSLLGVNAGAGLFTMLGAKEDYPVMRALHRSIGFAITGAAIWLSVSDAADKKISHANRTVAYGYTALTMVPLIIFNF